MARRTLEGAAFVRIALVGALSGWPLATASAAPTSRLVYGRGQGAEQCPDEPALRKAVAARVGYDPFFPWAELTVVASVKREGGRLHGHVELVTKEGVVEGARDLTDPRGDCSELVDSMALAISIALDTLTPPPRDGIPPPAPAPEQRPPAPAPAAQPPAPPSRTDGLLPAGVGARERPARPVLEAGLMTTAAAGAGPSLSAGGDVFAALRIARLSVAAEGHAELPASRSAPGGGNVSTSLRSGSIAACAWAGKVAGCGVFAVGSLAVSGHGGIEPTQTSALYAGAGLRVGIDQPLGDRLHLVGYGQALALLSPLELTVGPHTAWQEPRVAVTLGAGVSVRFW